MKSIILKFINFYQKFLTNFAYGSCRYYPTCSEYAKRQFQFNNIFLAFFNSSKRILSCNQLFAGGLDYPIVSKVKLKLHSNIDKIDFWLVPVEKGSKRFYLIKNFSNIQINKGNL
jgi:putative membrane protein insertion efficiency factor